MYRSVWQEYSDRRTYPALEGDRRCGVLVIGGGLAGILTASFLKKAGVDCLVAEGDRILSGVTAYTTAQINAQHELLYSKLIKKSVDRAAAFLEANLHAVETYKELATEIECDFEERDSYVYSLKDPREIEEEIKALDTLGYRSDFVSKLPLPLNIAGAYKFPKQAQFNPLKFAGALAEKLDIVEHTFIREIRGTTAYTDKGSITADKIVIATHFPFINTSGFYFAKMYQQRSYVLALEGGPDYNGMFADADEYGMYFRNYKNYLLLGGGDHRTGKKGGGFAELREFAKFCYPDTRERFFWATQDCITLDGMPYIGRYSKARPDVYVATGFNEFGMTGSMIAARVLVDLITNKESDCIEIYDPARAPECKNLLCNLGESVLNLLNPTPKRCTHLGCGLHWNSAEHTWDCPCHGSRFAETGEVLENPAMKNLREE